MSKLCGLGMRRPATPLPPVRPTQGPVITSLHNAPKTPIVAANFVRPAVSGFECVATLCSGRHEQLAQTPDRLCDPVSGGTRFQAVPDMAGSSHLSHGLRNAQTVARSARVILAARQHAPMSGGDCTAARHSYRLKARARVTSFMGLSLQRSQE